MKVNDIYKIEKLGYFTDNKILEEAKFVCFEDESKPGVLAYKIKIGKLTFTADITSEDRILVVNKK